MVEQTFVSTRLTQDEYTKQIEGPAVDAAGNLFVCNLKADEKPGVGSVIGVIKAGTTTSTPFAPLPVTTSGTRTTKSKGSGIRFDRNGRMYVADFANHNIFVFEPGQTVPKEYCHDAFNQPNDLAIARDGTLYASDPRKNDGVPFGRIWRITRGSDGKGRGEIMTIESGRKPRATNGLDLSPDERTLYVGEADTNIIWSYKVEGAKLTNEKRFAAFDTPPKKFDLDGMRTDIDGLLYVTHNGGGHIVVLKPDGTEARPPIATKGKNPSNLTFGGPDGKTVFVTVVKGELGYVESFRVDRPGREF